MTVNTMSEINEFENPNNFPLEELKLTIKNDGVIKTVPALDSHWITERSFISYVPPPRDRNVSIGALQNWKDSMHTFIDDLKWLLSLNHHKFWCNIVFHSSCMDMLVSFLQEANPPYLPMYEDRSISDLYDEAYKKVFIIFSRLVTNKEAPDKFISKEYFGKLIYDKYIFTIPILWDICLLYGNNNSAHISKLVKYVFTLQPGYYDDLGIAISFIKQVYEFIAAKFDNRASSTLPETFKGFSKSFRGLQTKPAAQKNGLSLTTIQDLVIHILDSSVTMKTFLELHNPARVIFRDNEFYASLVYFYENTIPKIYEKVQELSESDHILSEEIYKHLDIIRAEMLEIFRYMLNTTLENILADRDITANVNLYLIILTDALSEKAFIKDYNSMYSIEDDLDILQQIYIDMDPMKCDFILKAVAEHYDDLPIKKNEPSTSAEEMIISNSLPNGSVSHSSSQSPAHSQSIDIPEETKTQSLISEVKDILPDLGDGFILECLKKYEFNTENVISSILDGCLDESLQSLDPQLPIIPDDKLDEQFKNTGIDRINVFDNDEFDVMTRDSIDLSKIHKGKKKFEHKNLSAMLDDKSYIKQMKDTYVKYSVLSDDDEYDDTYDDVDRNIVSEASAESDRRKVFKVAFKEPEECHAESSDEPDDGESSAYEKPKDQFCVNPEELRAKYQAKRDLKYGHKPPGDRDVVGKAKGQGQEKDVLLNRRKKDAHKSSRANHNRRQGAQWKRGQGIVPS